MRALDVVRAVGMSWVRMYTSGLPDDVRHRRIRELESDLHEQARAASVAGGEVPAVSLASRFARGVVSDITWRLGTEVEARDEHDLSASWPGRIALALIVAIACTSLVYALLHTFGFFGHHRYYVFIQVGMMIGTLVLLGGFSRARHAPVAAALQILISGLGMAFLWGFMPPIAIALLVVTAYGLYRAYRFSRVNQTAGGARRSRRTLT